MRLNAESISTKNAIPYWVDMTFFKSKIKETQVYWKLFLCLYKMASFENLTCEELMILSK